MKTIKQSLAVAALAVVIVILGSCGPDGVLPGVVLPSAGEVGGILALVGNSVMSEISGPVVSVSRAAAPTVTVFGAHGGSATYTYTQIADSVYFGDIVFAGFTIDDPDGNTFTIDGTIPLMVDGTGDLGLTYSGDVSISKSDGDALTFSVEIDQTVTIDMGATVDVTVVTSGTVNGVDISGTEVYSFPVS